MLSGEVALKHGHAGLPEDTSVIRARGVGGQRFGAWLAAGVTLELAGIANDYVGKGLPGGRIVVHPPAGAPLKPTENIIVRKQVLSAPIQGRTYYTPTRPPGG